MKTTPLRIFILFDIIIIILIYVSPLNNNSNWAFGLMIGFAIIILPPLIIIELFLTIFARNISKSLIVLISFLSIPIIIIGTWKCIEWDSNIQNIIIIPKDYKKNYLIIVYNIGNAKSIDFSRNGKRELRFPDNGIFATSTELNSSADQLSYPRIFKSNGEEIKTNKGYFYVSNEYDQGYNYSVINLDEKIILDKDSLFKADKINFKLMDK